MPGNFLSHSRQTYLSHNLGALGHLHARVHVLRIGLQAELRRGRDPDGPSTRLLRSSDRECRQWRFSRRVIRAAAAGWRSVRPPRRRR